MDETNAQNSERRWTRSPTRKQAPARNAGACLTWLSYLNDWKIENGAPCGSLRIANLPVPGISLIGMIVSAPSSVAFAKDSSQFATPK